MANEILIRGVPKRVKSKIDAIRRETGSQNKAVIALLEKACADEPTLFDAAAARPQPISESVPFTFIDLFAGIGGLRVGFQRVGGECVFTSEWNKYAKQTYKRWFGEEPHDDITKIKPKDIPDHDVLVAG